MRIIARRTLKLFWEKHPDSMDPLKIWYRKVFHAKWNSFNQMKSDFGSADIVGENELSLTLRAITID